VGLRFSKCTGRSVVFFFGGPSWLILQIKGHLKRKPTDLGVVGWFLGGQRSTRVGEIFYRVF
jgi:hypothetical protein